MNILVLGATGMAGHIISIYLQEAGHNVVAFSRSKFQYVDNINGDARDFDLLQKIIVNGEYDAVVNAIGILNKDADGKVILGADATKAVQTYYSNTNFQKQDKKTYQNPIKDPDVKVEYYQNAPYVGLPAIVPFRFDEGWYVATDYIVSGAGVPFEASGRPVNFWICNVGQDGLIDYKKGDECRYINRGTGQSFKFSWLSEAESAKLVDDAERALREAERQYKTGVKQVRINNKLFDVGIAENGASGKCTDFMSPMECKILFNVCDPVICPASRCDLGGAYRVHIHRANTGYKC